VLLFFCFGLFYLSPSGRVRSTASNRFSTSSSKVLSEYEKRDQEWVKNEEKLMFSP